MLILYTQDQVAKSHSLSVEYIQQLSLRESSMEVGRIKCDRYPSRQVIKSMSTISTHVERMCIWYDLKTMVFNFFLPKYHNIGLIMGKKIKTKYPIEEPSTKYLSSILQHHQNYQTWKIVKKSRRYDWLLYVINHVNKISE
jgi:hypothetical protein